MTVCITDEKPDYAMLLILQNSLATMNTKYHFKFPENLILSFCIMFYAYHICLTWLLRTNFA